jgi:hypothetical protein
MSVIDQFRVDVQASFAEQMPCWAETPPHAEDGGGAILGR